MAESFAESTFKDAVVLNGPCLKTLLDTSSLAQAQQSSQVKCLPPNTSLKELLELGLAWVQGLPATPSYCTFLRTYHKEKWNKILHFRFEGQHAKCPDCEKLKEYRRISFSKQDSEKVLKAYHEHLDSMFHDRSVDAKLNEKGFQSCQAGCVIPESERVLNVTVDGMDTSKFRCPRNMTLSKEFERLFRPELKLMGVLIEGVVECYYLVPDSQKDTNLMLSLVGHSLDHALNLLAKRGLSPPAHIRIHSDNAPSDQKNQQVLKWGSFLTHFGWCKSVTFSMFRTGHSHNKIDQRFSEIRGCLATSKLLQNPMDFKKCIETGVKPREGRELLVEVIYGTYDWKTMLEKLGVSVSGMVQTHRNFQENLQACHYFELKKRKDMPADRLAMMDKNPTFPDNENDIILEVKLHIASANFAQLPQMIVPSSKFQEGISLDNLMVVKKVPPTAELKKEYLKTASRVSLPPWHMVKAQQFLEALAKEELPETPATQIPSQAKWLLPEANEAAAFINDQDVQFARPNAASVSVKFTAAKSGPTGTESGTGPKPPPPKRSLVFREPAPAAPGPGGVEPHAGSSKDSNPKTPSTINAETLVLGGLTPPEIPSETEAELKRPAASKAGLKRPAAAPKAVSKSKAKSSGVPPKAAAAAPKPPGPVAKGAPKAKAKAVIIPPGIVLGCSRCRFSVKFGCKECRTRAGLTFDEDTQTWK